MCNDSDDALRLPFDVQTLKWVDVEADPGGDRDLPEVLQPACLEVRSAAEGTECAVPRCDNRLGNVPEVSKFGEFTLVATGDRVIAVCPAHSPTEMFMHYHGDDDYGVDVLGFIGSLIDHPDD